MPRGYGYAHRHRPGHGNGWWHGRFRGCGYRITVPRQAVLEVLMDTEEHLSTEEIYHKLHRFFPGVGLASVYRTLELLVEMGIVSKFDFGDGKSRYELTEGPKGQRHHHHLVCTGCNRVIDYTDFINEERELLEKAEKGLSKKYEFDIKHHFIQFYGHCRECRKKR